MGVSEDVGGEAAISRGARRLAGERTLETLLLELLAVFCSFGAVKLVGEPRGHGMRLGDQASGRTSWGALAGGA